MTRPRTLTKYEDLRRHVRTHPGPWRRSLLEQRFGPRPVARAVHEQDVLTILPGIMITPAGVETTLAKTRAVAMWVGPQCAISGIAAAIMHGIELSPLEHITVQAPRSFKRSAPAWVRIKRPIHPAPTMTVRGVAVVDPIEATLQVWEDAHPRRREGMVLDCLRQGGGTIAELRERIDATPHRGCPRSSAASCTPSTKVKRTARITRDSNRALHLRGHRSPPAVVPADPAPGGRCAIGAGAHGTGPGRTPPSGPLRRTLSRLRLTTRPHAIEARDRG